MESKLIAAIVFFIVGSLHIIRAVLGWSLVVENFYIPGWVSLGAGILLVLLGVELRNK